MRHEQLPDSIDRTRLRSPHSATALAVNSFLPWQDATDQLPLAGWIGFDAVQFEVRCPTGLRGTPPHLDLLALRGEAAVAVTVRCIEYLSRRKTAVAAVLRSAARRRSPGSSRGAGSSSGCAPSRSAIATSISGALIKFALALGRTFPERPTTLLYLYWEPLDADQFEEFGRHRAELAELADAVRDARVTFAAQSFEAMWREWASAGRRRAGSPTTSIACAPAIASRSPPAKRR